MKITEKEASFQPVNILLETEEEFLELFGIINYVPVTDSCKTATKLQKSLSDILKNRQSDYYNTFRKITDQIVYKVKDLL